MYIKQILFPTCQAKMFFKIKRIIYLFHKKIDVYISGSTQIVTNTFPIKQCKKITCKMRNYLRNMNHVSNEHKVFELQNASSIYFIVHFLHIDYYNAVTRHSKKQEACPIRSTRIDDKKAAGKRSSRECKIRTGWTQEWTCSKLLRRKKYLDVHEVVRGPFSVPKLLTTQPFVAVSSCQVNEVNDTATNFRNKRNGIPDTWREYLISKGYCDVTNACDSRKDSIPCYVRCHATDTLWNELGLPFVQGIPDPWKSRLLSQGRSTKCCRQRCTRNKKVSTQTASNYDGDDEADVDRNAKKYGQCKKKRVEAYKHDSKDAKAESNLQYVERELHRRSKDTVREIQKNKQNYVHQATVGESIKSIPRKEGSRNVASGFDIKRDVEKPTVNVKMIEERTNLNVKDIGTNPSNVLLEKANQTASAQKPSTIACCNCTVQNYLRHYPNQVNKCQERNIAERVLCQDCEALYHQSIPRRLDYVTKSVDFCVSDPNKLANDKIVAREEIYKWTKLKICTCLQKAKQCFHDLNQQNCVVQPKNTITSKTDLKLVCCRCDCSYLRFVSNATDPKLKCLCKSKRSINTLRKERNLKYHEFTDSLSNNPTMRKQRNNTPCNSENDHCTCTGNKRFASKYVTEQMPYPMGNQCRNNPENKNVYRIPPRNNSANDNTVQNEICAISGQIERNTQNSTRIDVQDNIRNPGTKKLSQNSSQYSQHHLADGNLERKKFNRVKSMRNHHSRSDRTNQNRDNIKNKDKRNKVESNDTLIVDEERVKIKSSRYSKSDKSLKYVVSDSGEYADVSDNLASVNIDITVQDRFSVTSITFIQRLNSSRVIRRLYQLERQMQTTFN
ncbi:uncharacterized protein LOC143178554 [Calliopsis andreniformis]|uniref:uncharacterized protein LOC143178554 n=1 Tax=Calliopsis andreniformis TaxID=337506 RepID=UPI003FCC8202